MYAANMPEIVERNNDIFAALIQQPMSGLKTREIELQKELANIEVIKKSLIKRNRRAKTEENNHAEHLKLF